MKDNNKVVYAEVLGVLLALGNSYVEKIPSKMMDYLLDNCDKSLIPEIDKNIRIEEQEISEEARMLLIAIKLKFWCENNEERRELFEAMKKNDSKYDKISEENFNKDELVKQFDLMVIDEEKTEVTVNKKKNWLRRIIDKIKNIFFKS